jgi:ERF superfamily
MMSEQIDKLGVALSKAQSMIEGARKDSDNPFFKSKYADLASVWDACRKPLTDNGLSIIQTTGLENDKPILHTMLLHSSGQFISGTYPITSARPDAQSIVAALTYARRAALAAICGVAAIDDDDGNHAAGVVPKVNPLKELRNHAVAVAQSPGEYVPTFGKFKGMKLKDADMHDLNAYMEYIQMEALKNGKEITGKVAEFIEATDNYLKMCQKKLLEGID